MGDAEVQHVLQIQCMGDAEVQHVLQIQGPDAKEENSVAIEVVSSTSTFPHRKNFMWWIRMAIYTLLVLAGQTSATLLGKLYFEKGGTSTWIAGLVQSGGFVLLVPFYLISSPEEVHQSTVNSPINVHRRSPSVLVLASAYVSVGVVLAVDCMLFAVGNMYLPVSTYSLISSSQLAFNAFFSFFINSLKFTPFIINSLVVLTISSGLLIVQHDSSESTHHKVSKREYAIGFICTVCASAGYGLILSLTQWFLNKVIRKETFKVVLDMIIYPSLALTCIILVGLFASKEWKHLSKEMDEFELGKVSYVMTLIWTAVSWQLFSVGLIALIYEVSSLFSNVISTLGLPVVPMLATVFFHERMNGVKVVAMVLAVWGFISYVYQHYLDDCNSKAENGEAVNDDASKASITGRLIDEERQGLQ